jgi:hypothetical protein
MQTTRTIVAISNDPAENTRQQDVQYERSNNQMCAFQK